MEARRPRLEAVPAPAQGGTPISEHEDTAAEPQGAGVPEIRELRSSPNCLMHVSRARRFACLGLAAACSFGLDGALVDVLGFVSSHSVAEVGEAQAGPWLGWRALVSSSRLPRRGWPLALWQRLRPPRGGPGGISSTRCFGRLGIQTPMLRCWLARITGPRCWAARTGRISGPGPKVFRCLSPPRVSWIWTSALGGLSLPLYVAANTTRSSGTQP